MLARIVLSFIWIGLLAMPAWAQPRIDMSPALAPELRAALLMSLNLPALGDDASLADEAHRLNELVRALGYLDGSVRITRGPDGQGSDVLHLDVQAGPLYPIGSIQVIGLGGAAPPALLESIHDLLAATVGAPARHDVVSRLLSDLVWRARSASFAMVVTESVDLATDPSETAALTIGLTLGAAAQFGVVTFDSDGAVDPALLASKVPFSAGDPYSPAALDALDTALTALPRVRQSRIQVLPESSGRMAVDVSIRTHANPALFDHKAMGILLLGATLLTLGCRQIVVAADALPWSKGGRLVDFAIAVMLIGVLVLVVQRALAFAAMS